MIKFNAIFNASKKLKSGVSIVTALALASAIGTLPGCKFKNQYRFNYAFDFHLEKVYLDNDTYTITTTKGEYKVQRDELDSLNLSNNSFEKIYFNNQYISKNNTNIAYKTSDCDIAISGYPSGITNKDELIKIKQEICKADEYEQKYSQIKKSEVDNKLENVDHISIRKSM